MKWLFGLLLLLAPVSGQDSFTSVSRIVAVGDVHGGYEEFTAILRAAGVIDAADKWIGGATNLVQTGDVFDRGAQSRKVMDLLIALEPQAKRAKGRVHALVGNHEAMNMYGDLRYVSAGEYESYRTAQSAELRERAYEELADPKFKNDTGYRTLWNREHPLGWAEHRQAFSAGGKYGRFLRERPVMIRINDSLFLHGGISPKFATMPMSDINKKIRAELKDFSQLEGGVTLDEQGPLWYRGLAVEPEAALAAHLGTVLKSFGVARVVLGHTPTAGAVMMRFDGRVILIDVGLSKGYNNSPACLLLEDGKAFAIHRGKKLELPADNNAMAGYLNQAAALDPPGSNLRKFVETGSRRSRKSATPPCGQ